MSKVKLKAGLRLPYLLTEAVRYGRAILFLGAGASKECKNSSGGTPPNADQLRDILAQKYFGKPMPKRTVMSVAEMAINTGAGYNLVFETVNAAFEGFSPSDAHRLVTEFNWRTIATTNYDTFLESAYSESKDKRQTLIPFVKDDEPVDERMRAVLNPVEYLKLHGCLNHRLDKDVPLVLSWEEYATYASNRRRLLDRLNDLSHECPIIFVGYGLGDSHIRDLVYKLNTKSRPRWYIVEPGAEQEDIDYWASKNIEVLTARFGEFMTALDIGVPKLLRFVTPTKADIDFPLRTFYISDAQESDNLRASMKKDLTFVHASMGFAEQTASSFYSGYDTGWGGILNRFDARRKVTDDLLYKALLENETLTEPVFILLRGPAGAGKTIALKRAAFDAATANRALVLWLEESGQLRAEVFLEIADLTQKPIYLFVDQVALHVDNLTAFLRAMKVKRVPLVLIGAEREADWATYCGQLDSIQSPQFIRVGMLSAPEVENLLDLLARHDCLGDLKSKDRSAQVEAFMGAEQADRQLLVALHVLTKGLPFEKIVLNEYESVNPEPARKLYLDIATMHQFAVPIRAGTISRISGINFRDYEREFFAPLKDMILIEQDRYTGDYYYKTRHPRVASLVFKQVCSDDPAKAAQFIRLIASFDIGYSSDRRTLEGICRGRTLADQFADPDEVRNIYAAAIEAAPSQAYLYQQWAIFESNHKLGDIIDAEKLAESAFMMDQKNSTFIHTQAEVSRKRANREHSTVLKDQLRRRTRAFLDKMPRDDRFAISSRCKLLVDEVVDLSGSLSDQEKVSEDQFFAEKLRDAEVSLAKAQQRFLDEAEMIEVEARLWDEIKEKGRALKALERAWRKMPRGSGTAIRIAKIYSAAGRRGDERVVLNEALDREPEDKAAHFAMAMHLLAEDSIDAGQVMRHLSASYQVNDSNFEARYFHAQYAFSNGDLDTSMSLFMDINNRSPKDFRRYSPKSDNVVTVRLPSYVGTIDVVRDGFCFIRSGAYPMKIYANRTAFKDFEFDEATVGQEVIFNMRFNRSGPVAINVRVKSGSI